MHNYRAIVIGASAGGLETLTTLLAQLPKDFTLPIIAVLHRAKYGNTMLTKILGGECALTIIEPKANDPI